MSRWNRRNIIPYGQDPASSAGVNEDFNDLFSAVNTLDAEATQHGDDEEVHLPVIEDGDAGKVLAVNEAETGSEWKWMNVEKLLDVPGMAAKESVVNADELLMADSEASGGLKKFSWSLVKSTLKTYFDTLYQAVETALLKSMGTTKGDIIVFTGSSAPARLGVGTDGQILTADSAQAGGVKWSAAPAGGISGVVDDTTPKLGGNLDVNGKKIVTAADSDADIAFSPDGVGMVKFEKGAYFSDYINNGAANATIDWRVSNKQLITPNGTRTYVFTAPSGVTSLTLVITITAARTLVWPGTVSWRGGAPATTATGTYIATFFWDGTNYFGTCTGAV